MRNTTDGEMIVASDRLTDTGMNATHCMGVGRFGVHVEGTCETEPAASFAHCMHTRY
jgi:hypothetical protein